MIKKKLLFVAILTCLFFAIHPNHIGVIANIKARDNLLSMLFGLLASIQLIYYFDTQKLIRILLFLCFIMLAFLSKLDAYSFIIAPLLVIYFSEKQTEKILVNAAITLILFIVAFSIFQLFKSLPNKDEYIFSMGFDENPLVANNTFINRISVSLTSMFYYIKFWLYHLVIIFSLVIIKFQ